MYADVVKRVHLDACGHRSPWERRGRTTHPEYSTMQGDAADGAFTQSANR